MLPPRVENAHAPNARSHLAGRAYGALGAAGEVVGFVIAVIWGPDSGLG